MHTKMYSGPMPRPRKTDQPLTQTAFRLSAEELELFRSVAASQGVSVGQFLRSAGTAVASDPEVLTKALADQQERDGIAGGVAIPPATTDT